MSKLTRRAIEKAMAEAVQHMPIIVGRKGKDWEVEIRGMAIDVFIDELAEQGIDVDESLTDAEIAEIAGGSL